MVDVQDTSKITMIWEKDPEVTDKEKLKYTFSDHGPCWLIKWKSVFFMIYEFERFQTQTMTSLIIEGYHFFSNRVSILVEA